jgi:hypothetical protein
LRSDGCCAAIRFIPEARTRFPEFQDRDFRDGSIPKLEGGKLALNITTGKWSGDRHGSDAFAHSACSFILIFMLWNVFSARSPSKTHPQLQQETQKEEKKEPAACSATCRAKTSGAGPCGCG